MYKYAAEDINGELIEKEINDQDIIKDYNKYNSLLLINCEQGLVYILDLYTGRFFMYGEDYQLKDITPMQIENYLDKPPYKIKKEQRAILGTDALRYTAKTLGYEKIVNDTVVTICLVCWDNPIKSNEIEIDLRKKKWPTGSTPQNQ